MNNSLKIPQLFLIMILIIGILFCLHADVFAEQADLTEENTDITLNAQTITEKNYENNGLTGIYDVEMFKSDEENIFRLKENEINQHYENIVNSLFDSSNTVPHTESAYLTVAKLNLFSKVNYHTNITNDEDGDSYLLYIYAGLSLAAACVAGYLCAKVWSRKRRRKKGT